MNFSVLRILIFASLTALLVGCAPEKTVIIPTFVPPEVHPTSTSEAAVETTPEVTPSPLVTEPCTRGDYRNVLESGGQARQYLLHVPATYTPEEPAALVLVFHGAGITAERFENYAGFSHVADREGFLIVYPQGLGEEPAWNSMPGSRDVQFISELISHLERRCHIDPNRIYASGHSNGGGMVNRLACELADRIAAVGIVSGAYQSAECLPDHPIAVFAIHGTDDKIVPYDGRPAWALAWAQRNGCSLEPAEVVHNVLISERRWSNCRAGADVVLYTIQEHGHEWPSDLINAGQVIWDFFEEHPLTRETP